MTTVQSIFLRCTLPIKPKKKIKIRVGNKYTVTTLIQSRKIFIKDEKLVMESATKLGRIHGRDNDWKPETLMEAIEELESFRENSPQSNS